MLALSYLGDKLKFCTNFNVKQMSGSVSLRFAIDLFVSFEGSFILIKYFTLTLDIFVGRQGASLKHLLRSRNEKKKEENASSKTDTDRITWTICYQFKGFCFSCRQHPKLVQTSCHFVKARAKIMTWTENTKQST